MIYVVFVAAMIGLIGLCISLMISLLRDKEPRGLWFLIPIALCIVCIILVKQPSSPSDESDGEAWHGKQAIEHQTEVKQIAIPGIDKLYFVANQTEQQVNIYNPESNDCEIKFTLEVDGETLWQSAECSPGYGFYTINLSKPLVAGTYKGTLLHECSRNCKELNSARMNIDIIVE